MSDIFTSLASVPSYSRGSIRLLESTSTSPTSIRLFSLSAFPLNALFLDIEIILSQRDFVASKKTLLSQSFFLQRDPQSDDNTFKVRFASSAVDLGDVLARTTHPKTLKSVVLRNIKDKNNLKEGIDLSKRFVEVRPYLISILFRNYRYGQRKVN